MIYQSLPSYCKCHYNINNTNNIKDETMFNTNSSLKSMNYTNYNKRENEKKRWKEEMENYDNDEEMEEEKTNKNSLINKNVKCQKCKQLHSPVWWKRKDLYEMAFNLIKENFSNSDENDNDNENNTENKIDNKSNNELKEQDNVEDKIKCKCIHYMENFLNKISKKPEKFDNSMNDSTTTDNDVSPMSIEQKDDDDKNNKNENSIHPIKVENDKEAIPSNINLYQELINNDKKIYCQNCYWLLHDYIEGQLN